VLLLLATSVLALVSAAWTAASVADVRSAESTVRAKFLVLGPRDVPAGYTRVSAVHFTLAELAHQGTWSVSQLVAWGYVEGFESQFTWSRGTRHRAQLSSNAGVYKTARGAALSLAANANNCSRLQGWRELSPLPKIGDGAHACRLTTRASGATAITYFVVWRIDRYKGSISLTGPEGEFRSADALALARRQATKMRHLINQAR
jgi:hypothetical protein